MWKYTVARVDVSEVRECHGTMGLVTVSLEWKLYVRSSRLHAN